MTLHAPGKCCLWPCPKCFKAARKRHKIQPREPEKDKKKEKEKPRVKFEEKPKEKGEDNNKEEEKKERKKKSPCSGICSLWPCPNCVKAARKRHKAKLKQEQQETDGNPPGKPSSPPPKPNIQFYIMDPRWIGFDHPLTAMDEDDVTIGCDCGTCRGIREQPMPIRKAPPKPKDPVSNGPNNNLGFVELHPMIRQLQQQHKNGQQQPPQQQHATAPPPPVPAPSHGGSGQNVYIWPCGVSNITFPIVDYTRNPFAASGFPGPLFYMATLPNTAKVSDLVTRLAPTGSGKVLTWRSHKNGECYKAATVNCLASLQNHALQLEVWANEDDVDDSEGDGKDGKPRVTSTSTTKTNQSKKSKGKNPNPARAPSPDMQADAQVVQAVALRKRSEGSAGNNPDDAETIVHHPRDFSPQMLLPNFQTMHCGDGNDNHGEGPSGYRLGIIHNPKTRVTRNARTASYSSDEEAREHEYDTARKTSW